MKQFRIFGIIAAVAALNAAPVSANWNWNPMACGGTSFQTCISGDLLVVGNSIVLTLYNIGPGTITGVGLWNLGTNPLPISATTSLAGWNGGGTNDINGVVPDNKTRYAIGTTNGINDGFMVGPNSATFTFTFANDPSAFADLIGIGIHSQGGPSGCSTKLYLLNGSVGNPNAPGDTCVSVPEPTSTALLATGLLGLAFIRRRREDDIEV